MNRLRGWSLGAAGVAVLILVAGWFLLVSPTKGKVSDLHAQTASQTQKNVSLQTQINQLKQQNKDLPKQEAKLAEIRQHLPANPALPAYVRSLTLMAHKAGVKLVSVTPAVPSLVTVAPVVVATPSASPSDSASAGSETAVTPAAPVASTPLRMIPVVITVSGGYYNVVSFLNKVENLKRSMLVYNISVTEGATGPAGGASPSPSANTVNKVTATLQTRIFYSPPVVPTATTPAAGAAPANSGAAAPATAS